MHRRGKDFPFVHGFDNQSWIDTPISSDTKEASSFLLLNT